MSLEEKEQLIASFPFPWREMMELAKWKRKARLRLMDDKSGAERSEIEQEYLHMLDRILAAHQSGPT
jgi:hypothetical protein